MRWYWCWALFCFLLSGRNNLYLNFNPVPLTRQQIENIIDSLEEGTPADKAKFGIYYGGGPEEGFIRANREGLLKFSAQLLSAANNADQDSDDNKSSFYRTDFEEKWVDEGSQILVQFVEVLQSKEQPLATIPKETFAEKLVPIGCFAVIAILLVATIVGLWTLGKWIF